MLRLLSALGNYLTEPGDRNVLGFKVGYLKEPPKTLWQHWMAGAPEPEPTFTFEIPPPIVIERPVTQYITQQAPPPPPPPPEPKPIPPSRRELMQQIEDEYQEDLDLVDQLDDPMTRQAALLQAQTKRRRRIAQMIG